MEKYTITFDNQSIQEYADLQKKQRAVASFFSKLPNQPGFFLPNKLVNFIDEYTASVEPWYSPTKKMKHEN